MKSGALQKIVKEVIQEIIIVASISPLTSNITEYKSNEYLFDEIHLIKVELKNRETFKKVCELLQSAIPYPLIILLKHNEQYCFNTADKRINQVEKEKRVISSSTYTEWFDEKCNGAEKFLSSLAFDQLSHVNLRTLYESFANRIHNFNTFVITGEYQVKTTRETTRDVEIQREILNIKEQITTLRSTLKKETSFNEKVAINMKIKKMESEVDKLKSNLIQEGKSFDK